MKVLVYHRRAEELSRLIGLRLPALDVAAGFDDATLDRHIGAAEAIIAWRFPLEVLPRARRLRWIQLTSAGAEHLMPARAALRDIVVTNTRGIHADLMADYTLGVMLMLQWNFPRLLRDQQARRWNPELIVPLRGKCLGVVGAGAIGGEIARRAPSLGLEVIAVKRTPGIVEGASVVFTTDRLREASEGNMNGLPAAAAPPLAPVPAT